MEYSFKIGFVTWHMLVVMATDTITTYHIYREFPAMVVNDAMIVKPTVLQHGGWPEILPADDRMF